MTTKTFAYIRVSSKGQADEERDGLPRQRRAIEAFAQKAGYEIVKWFEDAGVSGTLEDRPGLYDLFAALKLNGVKTVLVEQDSRMARDTLVAMQLLKKFRDSNATVICVNTGNVWTPDADNPTAEFIWTVLQANSKLHKNIQNAMSRAARDQIRAAGKRCEGHPAYGYKVIAIEQDGKIVKQLVESPSEQAIIAQIKAGRKARKTWAKITKELNDAGVRTRRGTEWSRQRVQQAWRNADSAHRRGKSGDEK